MAHGYWARLFENLSPKKDILIFKPEGSRCNFTMDVSLPDRSSRSFVARAHALTRILDRAPMEFSASAHSLDIKTRSTKNFSPVNLLTKPPTRVYFFE